MDVCGLITWDKLDEGINAKKINNQSVDSQVIDWQVALEKNLIAGGDMKETKEQLETDIEYNELLSSFIKTYPDIYSYFGDDLVSFTFHRNYNSIKAGVGEYNISRVAEEIAEDLRSKGDMVEGKILDRLVILVDKTLDHVSHLFPYKQLDDNVLKEEVMRTVMSRVAHCSEPGDMASSITEVFMNYYHESEDLSDTGAIELFNEKFPGVINSHDMVEMTAQIFRFICGNGLVVHYRACN